MKTKFLQIILACVAILASASWANAQTIPGTYDPFTIGKTSLTANNVVSGSYLRYQVPGDATLTGSTFVWYVEGGVMGTYSGGTWTPIVTGSLATAGTGKTTTKNAQTIAFGGADNANSSEIWVRWDDTFANGYIAVYEISATSCIVNASITGYHVSRLDAVNASFVQATSRGCSADDLAFSIELSIDPDATGYDNYYPLTLTYTLDGSTPVDITINAGDVTTEAPYIYSLDQDPDFTVASISSDDTHTFLLTAIKDKNNAVGTFTADETQHIVTINHLPQTGTMVQN